MKTVNNTLTLTRQEFIDILNSNPDKSADNIKINGILIDIVNK